MLNKINIKFLILPMLFLLIIGCAFFRKHQKVKLSGEVGIQIGNNKLEFIDGEKYIEKLPVINKSAIVTWKKTKTMPILDKQGKQISNLREKMGYSYVVSPIKMNEELSDTVSLLILIETTQKGDLEYIVENLKLKTAGDNLVIKNSKLLPPEPSGEKGYVTSYPFGKLISDEVRLAFDHTYINGEWNYMIAELTLKNKKSQKLEIYEISLNSKFVHDLLKEVARLHPKIKEIAFDLFDIKTM
ncbi:S2/P23 family protein [Borrelia sp. A-FGy1]|uniref:S2/P23 family protein n=1 Tax=Borrelia sp. A-FGy1 TaxID=2608247 RepID=UPI0015F4E29E|nr:S2/P23 family protein [Borrelia sp. A-FGy1]QMU98961.1 S2/P23 family protein [Borrelia sp. A-FGy1]